MKNRFKIISLIFVILCAMIFVSCSAPKDESGGNNAGGDENNIPPIVPVEIEKQYNDNIKYKLSYTSEEECPNGDIVSDKLHASVNFEMDKTYYMVVDFTVESFETDGWDSSFSSQIKVMPTSAVSATLEEAATGNFTEKTEHKVTSITTTYSIPESRDTAKDYRIILQFKPIDIDMIDFTFSFYGDSENENAATDRISFDMGVSAGLEYALNEDGQSYSVVGGGHESGSIIIPTFYRGLPITVIDDYAFYNRNSLTSVTIHDCVTSIGKEAFSGCGSLAGIDLSDSLTSIGEYAFRNCRGLTGIAMPDSIASIGKYAFDDCIVLKGVYITDIAAWCNIEFNEHFANPLYYAKKLYLNNELVAELALPSSVTSIGEHAFYNCSSLTSITVPSSVTSIGRSAFEYCNGLTGVYISDIAAWCNIEFGSYSANPLFYAENLYLNNELVTDLALPDSVTGIGDFAFYNCYSLTSIFIPSSVTSIGNSAFQYCSKLTIYCESESKPSDWNDNWNYSKRPVVWGYENK